MLIPFHRPSLGDREARAVWDVILSGHLATGDTVKAFEDRFAEYLGVKHAVAVGSCTQGFQVLLKALGVGPGSLTIFPTWTFTGPPMMARQLGAGVNLTDVDPVTLNMRAEDALARFPDEDRPAAVCLTHFGGRAADTLEIWRQCGKATDGKVPIIVDAAHALPACSTAGTVGDEAGVTATVFSFYATKTLTTGHGGMVTTSDNSLAAELRLLRLHGMSRDLAERSASPGDAWRYDVIREGFKANMNDMAAAMGLVQLDRLKEMHWRRFEIAEAYTAGLAGLGAYGVAVPGHAPADSHHLYVIRVPTWKRNGFIRAMAAADIGCSVHFQPLTLTSTWQHRYKGDWTEDPARRLPTGFKNAHKAAHEVVSLPIWPDMTPGMVKRVIDTTWRLLGPGSPP